MTIKDSFNITQALGNQAYAYKCWYNYNYENNTMGIPSSDMGKIVTQYKGCLENWKTVATDDENKYEISDDDFNSAVDKGFDDTANKTGYEGNGKTGMVLRGATDVALGVAGVLGNTVLKSTATSLGKGAVHGVVNAFGGSTGHFDKVVGEKGGAWIITAPLALATGIRYQNSKPNKAQVEAARQLRDELLPEAQVRATEAQADMETADSELIDLTDEADMVNSDANDEIEENKSEFDLYKESFDALIKKVESGETLTEEEKELLKELVPLMQQLGEDISQLNDDTIEYIQELYEDMADYQEYYDAAAETIAAVQGITDYAESFDQIAQTMMYVEAGAQTLNAATGTQAAIDAAKVATKPFMWWAWAFVGMGAAGAAMSGLGAMEQMKWASETGAEIDLRVATQDLNAATNDVYDERVADYEGYMETVEDLEIEIPDDIEAPEETPEIPEGEEGEGDDKTGGVNPAGAPANGAGNPGNSGGVKPTDDIGRSDDYSAVMGYGADYSHIINGDMPFEQGTVLVNNKNKVVMSQSYAAAITAATGDVSGKRFSTDKVPTIIANLLPDPFDEDMIRKVMKGKKLDEEYSAKLINSLSGKQTGSTTVNNSNKATQLAKNVIDFYSAIFKGAANRGWTTGTAGDMDNLKKVKVG